MRVRRSTSKRFAAVAAIVVLFFATSVFVAHGLDGSPSHDDQRCQLCLQFGGTAGPAARIAVLAPAALPGRIPRTADPDSAPASCRERANQARAPPLLLVI